MEYAVAMSATAGVVMVGGALYQDMARQVRLKMWFGGWTGATCADSSQAGQISA